MDYMKLKLAIYESYGNGEMTSDACSHLIDHLDEKYGEIIAEEAASAENEFINASMNVFTESTGEEALTEAAKDFGAKIKAAWEKFKAWIKKIIEKILNLGKKPEQQKAEIKVSKPLDNALNDAKKWIAKLGGAKTVGAMAAAIAGIVSSTALIIKNRKLKETIGAKTYEYETFKKNQVDLVKQMEDAALKAQQEIANLKSAQEKSEAISFKTKDDLGSAKKQSTPDVKATGNNSDQNISDSKIISASTGLVNAVTSVTTYMLPQFSSSSAADLNGKIPVCPTPGQFGNNRAFIDMPSDLKLLSSSNRHNKILKIANWIETSINSISYEIKRAEYINKLSEVKSDIRNHEDEFEKELRNKLDSTYNLDTSEGIKKFANDYSLSTGLIGSSIKDAINLQKSQLDSIIGKYDKIKAPVLFKSKKIDDALNDYEKAYKAYNVVNCTYNQILHFAIKARKKINPTDKRDIY